jgi:hypothetical protein
MSRGRRSIPFRSRNKVSGEGLLIPCVNEGLTTIGNGVHVGGVSAESVAAVTRSLPVMIISEMVDRGFGIRH